MVPCFTPVRSPQSNGMAEAFVRTSKRDYVYVHDRPDAKTVLSQLSAWFEGYNEVHPHKALQLKSPPRVHPQSSTTRSLYGLIGATPWTIHEFRPCQATLSSPVTLILTLANYLSTCPDRITHHTTMILSNNSSPTEQIPEIPSSSPTPYRLQRKPTIGYMMGSRYIIFLQSTGNEPIE